MMETGEIKDILKRGMAALLSAAMVLTNTGMGSLSSYAGGTAVSSDAETNPAAGTAWSADTLHNGNFTDEELYTAVKKLYTENATDGRSVQPEIWEEGAASDFSEVVFPDEPVYADDGSSAEVTVRITPKNENTLIDQVRVAGYYGSEGLATLSDAEAATASNASGSDAERMTFTCRASVNVNNPVFIIYYRLGQEGGEGNLVCPEENAGAEYVINDPYVDGFHPSESLVFSDPLDIADITELWNDLQEYKNKNTEALTALVTGDVTDGNGKAVSGITIDTTGLDALFADADIFASQRKAVAASFPEVTLPEDGSFADLVTAYEAECRKEAADGADNSRLQEIYGTFFGTYLKKKAAGIFGKLGRTAARTAVAGLCKTWDSGTVTKETRTVRMGKPSVVFLRSTSDATLSLKWLGTTSSTNTIDSVYASSENAGVELSFSLGGTRDAEAGEIVLKVPYSIFSDRNGNAVGTVTPPSNLVSKEQYGPNCKSSGADFYYYFEDTDGDQKYDNIVFVNYSEVKTSSYFVADIAYSTGVLGYIKNGYEKNDIRATAAFTGNGEKILDLTTAPLTVQVKTSIPAVQADKRLLSNSSTDDFGTYDRWPDKWTNDLGIPRPTDADDYVYAVVSILDRKSAYTSEPYIGTMTETPANGGKVIAWYRYADTSDHGYYSGPTLFKTYKSSKPNQLTYVINPEYANSGEGNSLQYDKSRYDVLFTKTIFDTGANCIVAYPKSVLTENQDFKTVTGFQNYFGTVGNSVTITNTGKDGDTATSSKNLQIQFPKKNANSFRYSGNLYRVDKKFYAPIYPGLNELLNGSNAGDVECEISDFALYFSKYNGNRSYTNTLQDDYLSLDGTLLEEGDYELPSAKIYKSDLTLYQETFDYVVWNEAAVTDRTKAPYPEIISFYAYVKGAWKKVKDIDYRTMPYAEYIDLPSGTTKVKGVIPGLEISSDFKYHVYVRFKPSNHVKSIINAHKPLTDGLKLTAYNFDAAVFRDSSGKILNPIGKDNISGETALKIAAKDAADSSYGVYLQRWQDKTTLTYIDVFKYREYTRKTSDIVSTSSEGVNVKYTIQAERYTDTSKQVYSGLPEASRKQIEDGIVMNDEVFYDLLPKGALLDPSSIKLRDSHIWNSSMDYSYELIDNWRDSGRTMLIVRAQEPTQKSGWTYSLPSYLLAGEELTFMVTYEFNDLGTYGLNKINKTETMNAELLGGRAQISTGSKDDGKDYGDREGAWWADVNDDGSTSTQIGRASDYRTLKYTLSSEIGFRKSVKGSEDSQYSELGTSVGGGDYTYRLRFMNGTSVNTTGVVLYDVLENAAGIYTRNNSAKYWKGTLESIDVTNAVDKGIKPVIYYSTKDNLTPITSAEEARLSNKAVWSTTAPSDLSTVKAIAIDISKTDLTNGTPYVWADREVCNLYVHMKAPENTKDYLNPKVYAYNQGGSVITYALTGGLSNQKAEAANIVRNQLVMPPAEIHKSSDPVTGTEQAPAAVLKGSSLTYNVSVKNTGGAAYKDATVEDVIPDGLDIDRNNIKVYTGKNISRAKLLTSDRNLTLTWNGQKLTFVIADLPAREEYHFLIPTKVAVGEATFVNTAVLTKANGVELNRKSETTCHKVTPATVIISAKKTCTKPLVGDDFSFTIATDSDSAADTPLPAAGTVKNAADGSVTFDKISFEKTGTYIYDITEDNGGTTSGGITYDGKTVKATVRVEETAGVLKASVTYSPENATFANTYEATGTLNLKASKELKGKTLEDGEFSFVLQKNGADIQTVKNAADGSITFDPLTYTLADIPDSPIVYTLHEENAGTGVGNISFDSRTFTILVTLTDNGDGTIAAVPVFRDASGAAWSALTFSNTYLTTSAAAEKIWADHDDQDKLRPDSVTLKLQQKAEGDAAASDVAGKTVTLNKENGWKQTIGDLPQYNDDGRKLTYSFVEKQVPDGYTAEYSADGLTVTNRHTPAPVKNVYRSGSTENIDGKTVQPGKELRYTISYTNTTGKIVTASISDAIPGHTTYAGGSAKVETAGITAEISEPENGSTGEVTWDGMSLDDGVTVTVSFKVKADADTAGAVLTNEASVQQGKNSYHTNTTRNPVPENPPKKNNPDTPGGGGSGITPKPIIPDEPVPAAYPGTDTGDKRPQLSAFTPEEIPLGNIMAGIPKTGEERKNAILLLLIFTGSVSLLLMFFKRNGKE